MEINDLGDYVIGEIIQYENYANFYNNLILYPHPTTQDDANKLIKKCF